MKKLTILFLLAITSYFTQAQSTDFNLGLRVGVPQGEFKATTNAIAVGAGFGVMYQPNKKLPISFGGDLGILSYGNNTQRQTIQANITAGTTLIDVINMPLRISTNNTMYDGHFIVRAFAPIDGIKPYVEVKGGFRNLTTRTNVFDDSPDLRWSRQGSNGLIASKAQLSDWTYSYGYAAGIMFEVKKNLFIDLKASFLRGGIARFYDASQTENWKVSFSGASAPQPGQVNDSNFNFNATPRQARIDVLMLNAGITVKLR